MGCPTERPACFQCIKEGARGLVVLEDGLSWRKIDWLMHSLALSKTKVVKNDFHFILCLFILSHILYHLLHYFRSQNFVKDWEKWLRRYTGARVSSVQK